MKLSQMLPKTLLGIASLYCAGNGLLSLIPQELAAQGRPPARVITTNIASRSVSTGQTFVGSIVPLKTSSVGSAVDGRVTEYPINHGDRVAEGQALCQLLTETIRLQIEAAAAELRLREEELLELKNGTRPEEISQAESRMKSSLARRTYAESRYKRAKALIEQGRALTQEQYEEAISAFETADHAYDEAVHDHALLVKGPRIEQIRQAEARRESQFAMVEQLKDQLKKHTMIAPFEGYIVSEGTEKGEWVTRGQVVAEVVYLDEVDVEAFVLEDHVSHIRVGQEARVEIPALREKGLFIGNIAEISPQGDARSRTFPVKVRVKNQILQDGPLIKSGMLARVTLPTGSPVDSLLIPKDAIVLGGRSPLVYVVEAAPAPVAASNGAPPTAAASAPSPQPAFIARAVPISLMTAEQNWISVRGDLRAGQQIVVQGNERLLPFAPQPVEVMKTLEIPAELLSQPQEPAQEASEATDSAATAPPSPSAP